MICCGKTIIVVMFSRVYYTVFHDVMYAPSLQFFKMAEKFRDSSGKMPVRFLFLYSEISNSEDFYHQHNSSFIMLAAFHYT